MRKIFLATLCVTALLLLGYSSYRSYETWKQNHLLSMARHFVAESDLRSARLSLSELLQADPQNVEASRLIADLAETDQLSTAFLWRKRVVELDPHSSTDRLALAAIAVRMRDLPCATNALAGIEKADRSTAVYHNVAGSVDAAANRLPAAEAHFLEAARLEPQDPAPELSLAVLRLHDTNTAANIEARNTLNRLGANRTNSNLRCQAIRELAIDSIHHHEKEASVALSRRLVQDTNSLFTDRLLLLEALRESQNEGLKTELAAVERAAQTDPAKIQELAMWQLGKIPPAASLAWLQSLPIVVQTNPAVALLKGECFIALQDWAGLQACVETGNWAELEPVRHAFKTRALRAQGLNDAATGEWRRAVQAANGRSAGLLMLLRLAAQWNWVNEGEGILSTIVDMQPDKEWARQALAQTLFASGQTRALMQLYHQQAQRTPSDLAAKNNLAMTAMLLDAQELKPHELALELYQASPTNSSFAATYAFSLYQQGKKTEALKVLNQLDPQQLETASVAPAIGILLEATGDRQKAKRYLELASRFQMLPEERKLIDGARSSLDHAGTPRS
jgi:predicted Zn-dependent protease